MGAAKTKTKPRSKYPAGRQAPAVPLPPSCRGLLNRNQVREALGQISQSKFSEMVSAGEFPQADKRLGRSPRWSVDCLNQWVCDLAPLNAEGDEPKGG